MAASFDLGPDQIEPMLFLRITLPIEPSHGPSLATTTYLANIGRSPATHLNRRYAVHGHQLGGSPRRAQIKHQAWARGSSVSGGRWSAGAPGGSAGAPGGSAGAPGGDAWSVGPPGRRPKSAFRGSVEPMMQTNRVGG
jgi:hypothetical protein